MHLYRVGVLALVLCWAGECMACGWDGCLFTRPGDFVSNGARDMQKMAQTNIEQSLAITKSMSQGDVHGAFSHVGKLVVEGECIGCKNAISAIAGDASVDSVEQMVSVGFIVMTDSAPLFVTYDAVAKKSFLAKPTSVPPPPGPGAHTANHDHQTYEAVDHAVCIVASTKSKKVVAGFEEPPVLKNTKTNAQIKYFDSLLGPGDTIVVSAPLCAGQNSAKNHQQSMDKVTLVYKSETPVQRTGQKIHYEVIGTQA